MTDDQTILIKSSKFFPQKLIKGVCEIDGALPVSHYTHGDSGLYMLVGQRTLPYYRLRGHNLVPFLLKQGAVAIDKAGNIDASDMKFGKSRTSTALRAYVAEIIEEAITKLTALGESNGNTFEQRKIATAVKDLRAGLDEFTVEYIDQHVKDAQAKLQQKADAPKDRFQKMLATEKPAQEATRG